MSSGVDNPSMSKAQRSLTTPMPLPGAPDGAQSGKAVAKVGVNSPRQWGGINGPSKFSVGAGTPNPGGAWNSGYVQGVEGGTPTMKVQPKNKKF